MTWGLWSESEGEAHVHVLRCYDGDLSQTPPVTRPGAELSPSNTVLGGLKERCQDTQRPEGNGVKAENGDVCHPHPWAASPFGVAASGPLSSPAPVTEAGICWSQVPKEKAVTERATNTPVTGPTPLL